MMELRRLLPRQLADWRGKYSFEGEGEQSWRDCRVIDISTFGAGLELLDVPEDETVGEHILLAIHLRGELRNAGQGSDGSLRAGVKFVGLSEAEIDYMDSLAVLGAKW
jgi:PilZ domain